MNVNLSHKICSIGEWNKRVALFLLLSWLNIKWILGKSSKPDSVEDNFNCESTNITVYQSLDYPDDGITENELFTNTNSDKNILVIYVWWMRF